MGLLIEAKTHLGAKTVDYASSNFSSPRSGALFSEQKHFTKHFLLNNSRYPESISLNKHKKAKTEN